MFLRDNADILDNLALVDAFGNQMTYRDLEALSERYMELIPRRSLVFILCDYSMDTVSFYYCMMNNHVVPLLLDKRLNFEMLENLIVIYEPQYIWVEKKRLADFSDFVLVREYEQHVLLKMSYGVCAMYEELALLLTTSGSTGSPKLVRVSYENLRCNAEAFAKKVHATKEDKCITTLPMQFCYGLAVIHMHWIVGGLIILSDYSMVDLKFWNLLKRRGATNFAGVPYTYEILKQVGFLKQIPTSLRFLTEGGGSLSAGFQRLFGEKLQQRGISLFLCYGQTEATGLIATLPAEDIFEKIGSVGIIISGMEVLFEGEKEEGEVILKGSSISLGYAKVKGDLSRRDDNGGILHTGDLGFVDEKGYIYLQGRCSRIIKILGMRINLDEMEYALRKKFPDCEFACVGEDNALTVFYVGVVDVDRVGVFCKDNFLIPKKLVQLHRVQKIPRSSSGKILYKNILKE